MLEAAGDTCPGTMAWVPFSDSDFEDSWVYPGQLNTNRLQEMPWIIAQPNGGVFENCAALEPAYSTKDNYGRTMVVVDIGCARRHCYYCRQASQLCVSPCLIRFNGTIYFKLRGLCASSQLDFSYTLVRDSETFHWRGFTGKSQVSWEPDLGAWVARPLDPAQATLAVYTGEEPHPLGQEGWEVTG